MKRLFYAFLLLALTAGSFAASPDKSNSFSGEGDGLAIGTKAPDFSLKSPNGKTIKLSDYKGKIVIIDFWATWCPPCRKGIPDLISLQKEFGKDIVVIGISVDKESKMEVPMFIQKQGINYPIVFANETVVTKYGGISGIPTSFIVDQKGTIVDSHVGLVNKSVYVNKIKSLLKR